MSALRSSQTTFSDWQFNRVFLTTFSEVVTAELVERVDLTGWLDGGNLKWDGECGLVISAADFEIKTACVDMEQVRLFEHSFSSLIRKKDDLL